MERLKEKYITTELNDHVKYKAIDRKIKNFSKPPSL
jgi:hypothetical protein